MSALATQVGLQVLLQPYNSHTCIEAACLTVGILYPAFETFKAVEILHTRSSNEEATRWLTYWGVVGTISIAETILHKLSIPTWLPYYATLKLALLLWLQVPRFSGARRLSQQFVRPFLRKTYPYIDAALHSVHSSLMRPELVALGQSAQQFMARVPFLEWFMRGPDGRPYIAPPPPPPYNGSGGRRRSDGGGGNGSSSARYFLL